MNNLKAISVANTFKLPEPITFAEPLGNGHINTTFLVNGERYKFVLQQINHSIFKNVPALMENIVLVTNHFQNKRMHLPHFYVPLTIIGDKQNNPYVIDNENNYWRMYNYIPDSKTFLKVTDMAVAYEGGSLFGIFQNIVSDIQVDRLHTILPDFHNLRHRLNQFSESLKVNFNNRNETVKKWIDFVYEHTEVMLYIQHLSDKKEIPLRLTHNDTKFNNILFNSADKAISIIDLDTVMPGHIHFDYGDALRTAANYATEDEADIKLIGFNRPIFEAYSAGFLAHTAKILTKTERETLQFAPSLLAFIMGLRFLTDYLNGDVYYKIQHENSNLHRAVNQLVYSAELLKNQNFIYNTIKQYL